MFNQIGIKESAFGSENILSLTNPSSFRCRVVEYMPSHSSLIIQITSSQDTNKRALFENVKYFEGTLAWDSANFCIGSLDEYGELLYNISANSSPMNKPKDFRFLLEQAERLIIVKLPKFSIRIISNAVSLEDS